jgi:uncharacterized protein YcgI (DUF1989 family)
MTSASARYHHRRPFDQPTYDAVRVALATSTEVRERGVLDPAGMVIDLEPSDVVVLRLVDGPQIVHLHAWNRDDPDERVWTNETSSKENAFLVRDHRIWGTMARFRPLLTVVTDSLSDRRDGGEPVGPHHFVLGGSETPFAWRARGGAETVPTVWDRFRSLLETRAIDPSTYRDHVSLFQRIEVDVSSQRFDIVPSQARAGDAVALFAEVPLAVALVPCPSREGGGDPATLNGTTRSVEWHVVHVDVAAPGWPYPEVPYPDLAPYLDPLTGSRS